MKSSATASTRRRPTQLKLKLPPRPTHGGARKGAGRPRRSELQSHLARGVFRAREPLHLTLRLDAGLPSLRRKDVFKSLRAAVGKARARGLAVVHFSILSNHAHFIVETSDNRALGRQMQSLGISFSKRLNVLARRSGRVFRERYHVHVLKTPAEVKNALCYVLTNEYRHLGQKGRVELDGFSSALSVADSVWEGLLGSKWQRIIGFPPWLPAELLAVRRGMDWLREPRTWLLSVGWTRATT